MNFKEEYLFAKFKDSTAKVFRREVVKYKGVNVTDLYARIVKYQIKKYGKSLNR